MIKIIFFDIDGTLIRFKTNRITDKVAYALNEVQKKGVKLFIATGRPKFVVPSFDNVSFDGYLSYNGQFCYDKDGVLYKNPIDTEDIQKLLDNANKINVPVVLAGENKMGYNFWEQTLEDYFTMGSQTISKLENFEEFSKGEVYQMMYALPKERDCELLDGITKIKSTRWWDKAADLIPYNGGKEYGVQAVLKAYGYTKEEAMAFGDGGNDKTMLEAVGYSVAMGNAKKEVKEIASYITDSVDEDGIYTALVKFGMVDEL